MRPSPRLYLVLTSVWFIAFVALFTRLAFAWEQQARIPHQVLASVPFDQEAGNIALALSQGHGFSNLFRRDTGATAWLAPAYPFLLSLIFRVFGPFTFVSFVTAVLLNALCSAAATFPLFAVARRTAGLAIAAITAWAWACFPAGILLPFEWIWDTSLSVLLAAAVLYMSLRVVECPKTTNWLAYGTLWALALLTNPVLGIGWPFLFAWAAFHTRLPLPRSWGVPAISLAVTALFCLPWTVRNYHQFHRLIPIRSSLPFELWIGNNVIFDERAVHGVQRITRFEETHRYAQLGETAYLGEKSRLFFSFLRAKPALFVKLTGRRILATWIGTEHPYSDFLSTDSFLARSILVINLVLTLGTVAGTAILILRKSSLAWPLITFPLFYPLIYYLTHSSLRYRHPIDPFLILLTVLATAECARCFRQPARGAAFTG